MLLNHTTRQAKVTIINYFSLREKFKQLSLKKYFSIMHKSEDDFLPIESI